MIPVLYETNTMEFVTNGIGKLASAISCIITEERNGSYELEMTYPITESCMRNCSCQELYGQFLLMGKVDRASGSIK